MVSSLLVLNAIIFDFDETVNFCSNAVLNLSCCLAVSAINMMDRNAENSRISVETISCFAAVINIAQIFGSAAA